MKQPRKPSVVSTNDGTRQVRSRSAADSDSAITAVDVVAVVVAVAAAVVAAGVVTTERQAATAACTPAGSHTTDPMPSREYQPTGSAPVIAAAPDRSVVC